MMKSHMTKLLLNISLLALLLVFASCKENTDEPDWDYCDGCPNSTWAGEYEGTGDYYSMNNPELTESIPVTVTVTELLDNKLKFLVRSPNKFYKIYIGKKENGNYYFDLSASDRTIHVSLFQKSPQFKLTGSAKSYVYKADSMILEKSVSFEVIK